jgi:hypothetical protein
MGLFNNIKFTFKRILLLTTLLINGITINPANAKISENKAKQSITKVLKINNNKEQKKDKKNTKTIFIKIVANQTNQIIFSLLTIFSFLIVVSNKPEIKQAVESLFKSILPLNLNPSISKELPITKELTVKPPVLSESKSGLMKIQNRQETHSAKMCLIEKPKIQGLSSTEILKLPAPKEILKLPAPKEVLKLPAPKQLPIKIDQNKIEMNQKAQKIERILKKIQDSKKDFIFKKIKNPKD